MKPQEIYDKVLTHLRKQGKRSVDLDDCGCMYRGPEGTMCAVGCLIPDSLYNPIIEGEGIWGTENSNTFRNIAKSLDLLDHVELLTALQIAHDHHLRKGLADWEIRMQTIATMYKLTYTPPTTQAS